MLELRKKTLLRSNIITVQHIYIYGIEAICRFYVSHHNYGFSINRRSRGKGSKQNALFGWYSNGAPSIPPGPATKKEVKKEGK